jgi:hypothetical protein
VLAPLIVAWPYNGPSRSTIRTHLELESPESEKEGASMNRLSVTRRQLLASLGAGGAALALQSPHADIASARSPSGPPGQPPPPQFFVQLAELGGFPMTPEQAAALAPSILGPLSVFRQIQRSETVPFDLTGTPCMSVPCGFSPDGLPIGLHIAGRAWDEATVLRIGAAYEQATPWHRQHPNL